MKRNNMPSPLSAIRGSLLGGAVGDALGYPVEFMRWKDIQKEFGPDGIRKYALDYETGLALISDDTQMTLFTANGLLLYDTAKALGKAGMAPAGYIYQAYRDWYFCQRDRRKLPPGNASWLSELPESHARRAPGNTCLGALQLGDPGGLDHPINFSKGCGGVMRVAPVALWGQGKISLDETALLGAKAAALTHTHPLGYIPAAALAYMVCKAAFSPDADDLFALAEECGEAMKRLFPEEGFLPDFLRLMERAAEYARESMPDPDSIHDLGGGWTGDEAFAIALYCCLKYPDDFSRAVTAAVNHSGDSDSTGAVAGNILGAWLGYEAIEEKWLAHLELKSVLLAISQDLYTGCPQIENGAIPDEAWNKKYTGYLPEER